MLSVQSVAGPASLHCWPCACTSRCLTAELAHMSGGTRHPLAPADMTLAAYAPPCSRRSNRVELTTTAMPLLGLLCDRAAANRLPWWSECAWPCDTAGCGCPLAAQPCCHSTGCGSWILLLSNSGVMHLLCGCQSARPHSCSAASAAAWNSSGDLRTRAASLASRPSCRGASRQLSIGYLACS